MKSITRIVSFSWQLKKYYLIISVLTVVMSVISIASPLFVRSIIDELSKQLSGGQINGGLIVLYVSLIILFDILISVISNIIGYFGDILAVRLKRLLSNRYYEKLLLLPQKYFDNERTGAIIARLTRSIDSVTRFVQMFTNNFFSLITETILTLVVVAYFSWQVAVLLIILYPTYFYLTKRTSTKWQVIQKDINEQVDVASSRFAEVVSEIKVVRSFGRERDELRNFNNYYKKIQRLTKTQSIMWHKNDLARRLSQNIIFGLLFGVVFYQGFNGALTIGEVVLLIQYSVRSQFPLFSMSFLVDNTQKAIADSKDYFEVIDLPVQKSVERTKKLKITEGSLAFESVSFGYNEDELVLNSIDLNVKPGSKVAIIGESGGGKTTIANLLLGLYEPTGGKIKLDGVDITKVSGSSLRRATAVVFQDAGLFSGTIAENISYGVPDAELKQIKSAAVSANANGFITNFELGYETLIGERGLKLSGGQKQRIAIARAILKDAPILILDEATSSLDSKSELVVQDALASLMKNRTSIIIAHRLSTIADVDQIITLDKGRVVEAGSPSRLAKSGGIYSTLLSLQSTKTKDRKKALAEFDLVG